MAMLLPREGNQGHQSTLQKHTRTSTSMLATAPPPPLDKQAIGFKEDYFIGLPACQQQHFDAHRIGWYQLPTHLHQHGSHCPCPFFFVFWISANVRFYKCVTRNTSAHKGDRLVALGRNKAINQHFKGTRAPAPACWPPLHHSSDEACYWA